MKDDAVVDTSILMAILRNEAIHKEAYSVVTRGVVSTVNLAEFYSNLSAVEMQFTTPVEALLSTVRRVEIFTPKQAQAAGKLREATRHAGLSLGPGLYGTRCGVECAGLYSRSQLAARERRLHDPLPEITSVTSLEVGNRRRIWRWLFRWRAGQCRLPVWCEPCLR